VTCINRDNVVTQHLKPVPFASRQVRGCRRGRRNDPALNQSGEQTLHGVFDGALATFITVNRSRDTGCHVRRCRLVTPLESTLEVTTGVEVNVAAIDLSVSILAQRIACALQLGVGLNLSDGQCSRRRRNNASANERCNEILDSVFNGSARLS